MERTRLYLAVAGLAFGAAASVDLGLAEYRLSTPYNVVSVPTGKAARVAALGHRTFVSDMYWLAAVQYIGEPRADERGWEKLLPLLDLVTDLDPRHGYAYQTGGIVLSAVGRLDESDRILLKGLEKAPRWTFPFYISFNNWFYRGDFAAAAKYAEIAARQPGASPNISQLAVSLAAKSGTPEEALEMLDQLRATVTDDAVLSRLDEQRNLAVLERDAQAIEKLAARFQAEKKRPIRTVDDLVAAGYIPRLPRDPFGGKYTWNGSEGRVHSTANSFRFSKPEKPSPPPPGFYYKPPETDLQRRLK
jgi:tetratricopeptide (TPR) repeat protein